MNRNLTHRVIFKPVDLWCQMFFFPATFNERIKRTPGSFVIGAQNFKGKTEFTHYWPQSRIRMYFKLNKSIISQSSNRLTVNIYYHIKLVEATLKLYKKYCTLFRNITSQINCFNSKLYRGKINANTEKLFYS